MTAARTVVGGETGGLQAAEELASGRLDFAKPGCLSQSGNHGMGWGKRRQKLEQNESVKI